MWESVLLITAIILTIALVTFAVIRGENRKRKTKINRHLWKNKSPQEIIQAIETESEKIHSDKLLIDILNEKLLMASSKEKRKTFIRNLPNIIFYLLFIFGKSLFITGIIGVIIYMLSLIISIINFSWLFIGIVFCLVFMGSYYLKEN